MNADLFRIQRPFSRWRVRPYVGEGAFSYFHRLVRDHDDVEPRAYANAVGLPSSKIGAANVLASLLKLPISGQEKASLKKWTVVPQGRHFTLNGVQLDRRIITMSRKKHCPSCVREAPFHRAWWDLEGFEMCPIHQMLLVSSSDRPDGPWPPFYGRAMRTSKAYDQINAEHDSNAFETYLLQRVGFLQPDPIPKPLIDNCTLDDVIWYSGTVGRWLRNPRKSRRPSPCPADHQSGFEALRGHREDLIASVTNWIVLNNSEKELSLGTVSMLGWAATFAQSKGAPGATLSPLAREIILAQTLACARVGKVGYSRLLRSEVPIWPISFTTTHKSLGVTIVAAKTLAKSVGITPVGGAVFRHIAEAEFMEMARYAAQTIPQAAATALLGCTEHQLDWLARNAFVRRIAFTGKPAKMYFECDVKNLLSRIEELPPSNSADIDMAEAARRTRKSTSAIISGFLKGQYAGFRAPSGRGFQSLRLSSSIPNHGRRPHGRPHQKGRKNPNDFAMLRTEFAVMTGIRGDGFSGLIREGHIKTVSNDGEQPRLTRESAMAFHEKYLKPSVYLDVSNQLLRRELSRLRIPIHFDEICPCLIVERAAFEKATGLETLPRDPCLTELWRDLREAFAEHAPSFIVPVTIAAMQIGVWTTAIKAKFNLYVEGHTFRFEKHFCPNPFRREWKIYSQNRRAMWQGMGDFSWECGTDGDIASFKATGRDEIIVAAKNLGVMCDILRMKQPDIRRLKKG